MPIEEAKKILEDYTQNITHCGPESFAIATLLEYVRKLEKEQEPKTGHWIEEFNDIEGEVRFTCSNCGKYQLFATNYCYDCGSKNE